jgi:hypothetical protein
MFEQAFKNVDDLPWREAGCTAELDDDLAGFVKLQ